MADVDVNQKNSPEYQAAKRRVRELKDFYSHLLSYVMVNLILIIINFVVSPGAWWFYWVSVFWGIGLISHAFGVYGFNGMFGKEWEERKIDELIQKNKEK